MKNQKKSIGKVIAYIFAEFFLISASVLGWIYFTKYPPWGINQTQTQMFLSIGIIIFISLILRLIYEGQINP